MICRGAYAFRKCIFILLASALVLLGLSTEASARRRFTVVDDIGLTLFDPGDPIKFSPDNTVFVVIVSRGRVELNSCESALRFYRTADVEKFLSGPTSTTGPSPFWTVTKSTYPDGPIISSVRWLRDSSAVVFLAKTENGHHQLVLADIQSQTLTDLTPLDQEVTGFDVRSRDRFVYTVLSPLAFRNKDSDTTTTVIIGNGRPLNDFLFRKESKIFLADLSEVWVNFAGTRRRVDNPATRRPLAIHSDGQSALALSPDGLSVITASAVQNVPSSWETLYPTSAPADPKITPGQQDPNQIRGNMTSEYIRIELATGNVTPLTYAPLGAATGWVGMIRTDWSRDGHKAVLTNTFLGPEIDSHDATRNAPCVAVLDLDHNYARCLQYIQAEGSQGYLPDWHYISNVRFLSSAHSEAELIEIEYWERGTAKFAYFEQLPNAMWREMNASAVSLRDPRVSVEQGPNEPPLLVAVDSDRNKPQVIWNPNPELTDVSLGHVSLFKWKASDNRDWEGQLYTPPDYVEGVRYPLVIQTHGISTRFSPSGVFTTAFAAQELAAFGILVLQVRDCSLRVTPDEGPCQVAGYESAVDELAKEGKIDPNRVGIIGFSRTCYYVLEALTTSRLHFKAASITDGVNEGYLQYIVSNYSYSPNILEISGEADAMIGARPFGQGLQQWFKKSPLFNMDKVCTPLAVDSTADGVLFNWEPYATLWYLNKPVELRILNSTEHVFTNPAVRLASQGHSVDWFRFWLKNERDSDPAKAEQYKRWDELARLQMQEDQNVQSR